MGLIFVLSGIPDLRSGFQPLWDLVLRKFAHAAEYVVLAVLIRRAVRLHGLGAGWAGVAALALTIVYALTDELHQRFVPGRHGALADVGVDALGAALGLAVISRVRQSPRP